MHEGSKTLTLRRSYEPPSSKRPLAASAACGESVAAATAAAAAGSMRIPPTSPLGSSLSSSSMVVTTTLLVADSVQRPPRPPRPPPCRLRLAWNLMATPTSTSTARTPVPMPKSVRTSGFNSSSWKWLAVNKEEGGIKSREFCLQFRLSMDSSPSPDLELKPKMSKT